MADRKKQSSMSSQHQRLQETFRLKAEKIKLQRKEEGNFIQGEKTDRSHHAVKYVRKGSRNQARYGEVVKTSKPKPFVTPSKIPVRVTAKVSEVPVQKQQPRKPQQPVTLIYDWAEKGRIQELKIRYLARKYLTLWRENLNDPEWQKSLIGRRHYKQRLLNLTFGVWKDLWWTQRKEWSLAIRAEYHFKYHLYLKVWRAWQVYVVRHKVKKAKTSVAVMQGQVVDDAKFQTFHLECIKVLLFPDANYGTLRRYFHHWKQYHQERQRKEERKRQGVAFSNMRILHHFFVQWCDRMEERREDHEAKAVALNHWASQLTQRVFEGWKLYIIYRQEKRRKEMKAVEFYDKSLLAKCLFQGFLPYILHRRDRQQAKGVASQAYMDQLLYKSFHHWHGQLVVRRCMAQKQEEIHNLGQRSRMRRILQHWKYYVKLCYDDRQNHRLAVLHHERTLLRLGFSSLHRIVIRRRLKILQKEEADNFHKEQVLKCAWRRWTERMEEIEEQKMKKETEKARKMFRMKSLRIAMDSWKHYWRWRHLRKNEYIMAEAHYVRTLCSKSLHGLALNVEYQKVKQEDGQLAEQFYREHVLSVTFNLWWKSYQLSLDRRMMERMAILHHERKSLQRAFTTWKESLREILAEQENMDVATQHYVSHLCRKCLLQWQDVVKETKQSNANDIAAVQHNYSHITQKVWNAWREYVHHRKHKCTLKVKAADHHGRKLLQLVMNQWKNYHADMKKRLNLAEAKYNKCMKAALEDAFHTWKSNAKEHAKARELGAMAVDHRQSYVVHTVFSAWHQYAISHAIKVTTKEQQLTAAHHHLKKLKLKRIFCHWHHLQEESADTRKGMYLALRHHNRKVLQGALYRWKEFRKLQTKKMLLQRQCVWLHSTRIQAKYFLQWRAQYCLALQEHSQTTTALWQWSLVLQHKVLHAWYRYMLERRRKKKRIEGALAARHKRLLQDGLRQWVITADSLSEKRISSLAYQKTKETKRVFHVVRRCAMHWRRKTVENRDRETSKQKSDRDGYSRRKERLMDLPSTSIFNLPTSSSVPAVQYYEGLISRPARPRPKRPDFLRDSLQNAGLWESPSKSLPSPSDSSSYIHPDKTDIPVEGNSGYVQTIISEPRAASAMIPQSVKPPDMGCPSEDKENRSQDSHPLLQDNLSPERQGTIESSHILSSGRPPDSNGGALSSNLSHNKDLQWHDGGRNVSKESVKGKLASTSKKLLPPSAFMNTTVSQMPVLQAKLSLEGQSPKKYADDSQPHHKVLISPEMLKATAGKAEEVSGHQNRKVVVRKDKDAFQRDENVAEIDKVGFANRGKVLLSPEMIASRGRLPLRDNWDERTGHTNKRDSTGSDTSEESVEYSEQPCAEYPSLLQSKAYSGNAYNVSKGGVDDSFEDLSGSEREMGTSDGEMYKEEEEGKEEDDTKQTIMQLKNLLLKYQKHKEKVSILEDQKKAMEFLLEESISPDEDKYSKETTSEEYGMVLNDLCSHTQTLEVLKTEISTVMAKLKSVPAV